MKTLKLSELVFDFDLYPRAEIDSQHVHYMAEAHRAGVTLPPIVIDKKSRRIIDGFHRARMYAREKVEEVEVVEKTYKTDAAMFLDAIRYNAHHGRTLSTFDRTHCLLRAETLQIETDQLASALSLTCEAVGKLRTNRVGNLRVGNVVGGRQVPLKRTIAHMAGKSITRAQEEANGKLSGMAQGFYVNQLIMLIENGLLDKEDEKLMERLERLAELLSELHAEVT